MDLQRLYTEFKNPGAFRGKRAFYNFVKSIHPNVTRKDINNFLISLDSYTLHKPKRKVKIHRRIFSKGIGYQVNLND